MADCLHVVCFIVLDQPQRRVQRTGLVIEQFDPEIHLEEREALLHPLFEREPHIVPGVFAVHVGIAVDTHLVAPFTAEQLVDGDSVELTDNVPERNLDAGHAAALAGVTAELFNPIEDFLDVQRIFTDDSGFEHFGIRGARRVTHFAVADDAGIGIEFQKNHVFREPVNVRHPQVCDFQFVRTHKC